MEDGRIGRDGGGRRMKMERMEAKGRKEGMAMEPSEKENVLLSKMLKHLRVEGEN